MGLQIATVVNAVGLVNSVFGGKKRVQFIQDNKTVITLDASLEETHSRESPASEFPIESGGTINENIWVKPFVLEIHGIISDTPLGLKDAILTTAVSAAAGPVGVIAAGVGKALFAAITDSKSPSVQAFERILQMQDDRKTFNVFTSLRLYRDMAISAITVPRNKGNGNALEFTIHLGQLIIVQTQSVNITLFANPDVSSAEADEGQQQANQFLQGFKNGQATFDGIAK